MTGPTGPTLTRSTAPAGMLGRQVGHDLVGISRTPVVLFFALAFPLVFFVVLSALVGNETLDERSGVRLAQFLAPTFAAFGVAMATFSFLGIGFAELRFAGVLRRLGAAPLSSGVLIAGRVVAGTLLGLGSVLLLMVVGVLAFDVQILWRTVPAVLLTVVVASMSFSALGLAVATWAPSLTAATAITNVVIISLAFVSDLFLVTGSGLPDALETLGWAFPLRHLTNAMADGFNPFIDGNGFSLDHLAVIAAWGVAGGLLAAWGVRRAVGEATTRTSTRSVPVGFSSADNDPRRSGRPSPAALLSDQVRHAGQIQLRDPGSVFFAVAFPALLVALIPTANGGADATFDDGTSVGQFFAATMAVYGAAVAAFVNLPQDLAETRSRGALKRYGSAPLPMWVLLAGRVLAAVALSLLGLVAVYAVAIPLYGVVIPSSWPSALVLFVLAAVCFATVGLAVVSFVGGTQSVLAVCLGSLVLLSFFSDIFVVGVAFPAWLEVISWTFPLRHAAVGFADAMAAGASGWAVDWEHVVVILAWTVAAVIVVRLRFRLEPA